MFIHTQFKNKSLKISKMKLPCDPAIPLPDIHLKNSSSQQTTGILHSHPYYCTIDNS